MTTLPCIVQCVQHTGQIDWSLLHMQSPYAGFYLLLHFAIGFLVAFIVSSVLYRIIKHADL